MDRVTTPGGVRARARVLARGDGRGGTALPVLEGEGPLAVRRTRGSGAEAHVMLVGAMSGPLGGDQDKAPARYDVRLSVGDDAELCWLPEQLISAHGSELTVATRVDVAASGRLLLREEQVLGRSGEEPGRLTSRLTVRVAGRCVLDQELACGPGAPGGWDGPAGLAGHRAAGQLVVVRPQFAAGPPPVRHFAQGAAVMPLAGPAVLVTAVAPDGLRLRRLLEEGLASLD